MHGVYQLLMDVVIHGPDQHGPDQAKALSERAT